MQLISPLYHVAVLSLTKAVHSARQFLLVSAANLLSCTYGSVLAQSLKSICLHPFSAVLLNPSALPHYNAADLQLRNFWHQCVCVLSLSDDLCYGGGCGFVPKSVCCRIKGERVSALRST